jgi:hypothetical protein
MQPAAVAAIVATAEIATALTMSAEGESKMRKFR